MILTAGMEVQIRRKMGETREGSREVMRSMKVDSGAHVKTNKNRNEKGFNSFEHKS